MTKVTISNSPWVTEIRVKGHAGFNPGNDIVCAAISNTSYMLLNFMLKFVPDYVRSYQDDPGDFRMDIRMDGDKTTHTRIKTALEMFKTGIEQISVNYPKHCTLEVKHDAI